MARGRVKALSEYSALSAPSANSVLLINDGTAVTANTTTKTVSVANLLANSNTALSSNSIIFKHRSTPANSTANCTSGQMWFDTDYLYIATANNTIKRIALVAF